VFVPATHELESWREAITKQIELLIKTFEIKFGLIHPEYFVTADGEMYFCEVAYRPPGFKAFELIDRAYGFYAYQASMLVFDQVEQPPFGLDRQTSEHIRATSPLVGVWYALFALPLFLWTADRPASGLTARAAVREGLRTLLKTLRQVRRYSSIVRFLVAHMIYADGLVTLFAFAGIYAAGTFGMEFTEVIWLGIALNVTAGAGAALFAWVDDKAGSKTTIAIALTCLFALGVAAVVVESKQMFWLAGMAVGVFVGPAQAASRSMMARLAPRELQAEMFGLFALSGKATTFLGPIVLGTVTEMFDSQRAGMASVLCFFLVGLLLLIPVKEPPHAADPIAAG
jgi:UMF1 family MFS transporter